MSHEDRLSSEPLEIAAPREAQAVLPLLRALIVEDSENDYLMALAALRRGGFRVESVRVDTADALQQMLEMRQWDVVLADFSLPQFDGPSALRMVRHYLPDIPFVLITGNLGADLAAATMAAGANDAVAKTELAKLVPIIKREIAQARVRQAQRGAAAVAAQAEVALRESEARFTQLAEQIPDSFWLYDLDAGAIVFANQAYERIWGRPVASLYADPLDWIKAAHPDDAERVGDACDRARFGGCDEEFRILRPDGEVRWVHVRTFAIRDSRGLVRSVSGIATDVSHVVEQQVALQRLAHYDSLTALPNRFLFQERLRGAVSLAKRNHWQMAVMFIDLDRFKNVNDTLGHGIGDDLLRMVALRLRACLRESDTVGRLGGDEFAVIVPDLEWTEPAAVVAQKIIETIEMPFTVEGHELFVSASVGITVFPEDAEDVETLIKNADIAMYRAKEAGRNTYEFYRSEMNQRARERLLLENDLRRALAKGEYELFYQPKVCCRRGVIVGTEALLRWRNAERGLVSPADFVPLLEETGLIVPVGDWVLAEACRQVKAWRDEGLDPGSIAINLAARQLEGSALLDSVRRALDAAGLEAAVLELELTESTLMRDAAGVTTLLAELKAMGVTLSVDDFGTGYSSLAYLKRFPLNCLKVDRSFVQDIVSDPDDASITRAIITMAHALALKVVAEGVETAEQLRFLIDGDCDQIQGYFFSRPVPAADMGALLRSGRTLDVDGPPPSTEHAVVGASSLPAEVRRADAPAVVGLSALSLPLLKASYGLLDESLRKLPWPLLGIDDDGLIAFVNPAAERLLLVRSPLLGMDAADCLPPALLSLLSGNVAVSGGIIDFDGAAYRVHVRMLGDDGEACGRLVFMEPARGNP